MRQQGRSRKIVFFILVIAQILVLTSAASASGTDSKVVRVGWHEVPYFIEDQYGRWSGYSYEYQCKVAAYTGWTYEYVFGTWSELLQMLMDGEIDMLGNLSYLEERALKVLYSSVPMGTESYYLFISPDNTGISADDFTTLNGKRVGVTRNSFQKEAFLSWLHAYGVEVELVEMSCSEEESLLLLDKEFDAFVSVDVYGDPETAVPLCKIGSSDFFFAISKDRPDLLLELDAAMNRIQDENKYYNLQLHEKYLRNTNSDRYLNIRESEWLSAHGAIRVGYQDNYLAFCASDPETGELTGALKDYLTYASSAMENAHLEFVTIAYPTAAAAVEALKNGEVDCVFPANLTSYDSEVLGVVMTPALMRTEMDAVVRASDQKEFIRKDDVTVAVNEGNTNYDMFLADNYPTWNRAYFPDTPAGLEAVAAGEADCVIISNYRYGNISKLCEKLHLTTVYTGVDMDYCFAVLQGNTELYSILARLTNVVPDATIHSALTYYSTEDVKVSFLDLIMDNLHIILIAVSSVSLVIVLLLARGIYLERKARREEHIVEDLNRKVFMDALTSVRNKGAFNDCMHKLQDQIDSGSCTEFGIGIFDCNNLKRVNDRFGHDNGDLYLKTSCSLICKVFKHSPVFRIGGDEFAVVLQNQDFHNMAELVDLFEKTQEETWENGQSQWDGVRVAFGIAVYDPATDQSAGDTVRRADRIMYENKRMGKAGQK